MLINLLIGVVVVLVFVGFLVLGKQQVAPSTIIFSTQDVAQQVPAELMQVFAASACIGLWEWREH